MSAPERIPPRSVTTAELLAKGELKVRGRIREASNAVLFCSVTYEGREASCVYKPVAGERPLWDFPDGNLAQREVAAYEVSEATGWGLVPTTVLRDGPYGEGMCQLWIEAATDEGGPELLALVDAEEPEAGWKAIGFADVGEGKTALLVHADDERLRRLAVLDAVINNADRKGGHLLPADGGAFTASTTVSPSTPRTSCAPSCGAGRASPSPRSRSRSSRGSERRSGTVPGSPGSSPS